MSECGKPCRELIKGRYGARRWQAHIEFLKLPIPNVGKDVIGEAYVAAGYKPTTRNSRDASASALLKSPKMAAALQWHRDRDSKKFSDHKARSIARLEALAENATMGNFATVKRRFVELLTVDGKVVAVESEDIELLPWKDKPLDQLRAVGKLSKKADGTIEITVRDPVAAERLLADIGGWKEPEKADPAIVADREARTRLLEMLARRAEAKPG